MGAEQTAIRFYANLEVEPIIGLLVSRVLASRVQHCVTAAKPKGSGQARNTQHVTDAYTENCIKIAVLAIVAFAIAVEKQLYSTNATGY